VQPASQRPRHSDGTVRGECRIASQRRSIDRIRVLLDQAADLDDVVRIESELATREADLDSLLRRQEELAELTSLATVTVTFVATDSLVDEADVSFVSGLPGGWNALVDAATVATAVIGALLPFAVVAAALGVPGVVGPAPPASGRSHPAGCSAGGVNGGHDSSQDVWVGRR
jgi:Domain of unknown function (DUF4349)